MKPIPAKHKPGPQVGPQLSTGFPSPAEDYEEPPLDLHEHTVANPLATYFMRADASALQSARIYPGDILVVDRSIALTDNQIVVAIVHDRFVIRRCRVTDGTFLLEDDNETVAADHAVVWGIVTYVVHKA